MRAVPLLIASALIGVGLLACGKDGDHPAPWSYSGETGPGRWGALDAAYAACSGGQRQSPVDIAGYAPAAAPALSFAYVPDGTHVTTGTFLKVKHEGDSRLTLGESGYQLVNVHAHTPAEHTLNGERFPLELHLVHTRDSGEIAVVGILYRQGDTNPALQTLLDAAPPPGDPASPLDPSAYLPAHASHYRYSGSLTTPPCTEGVQWLVLTEVAEVSDEQLRRIAALTGDTPNNRPAQPLGDRTITLVE